MNVVGLTVEAASARVSELGQGCVRAQRVGLVEDLSGLELEQRTGGELSFVFTSKWY